MSLSNKQKAAIGGGVSLLGWGYSVMPQAYMPIIYQGIISYLIMTIGVVVVIMELIPVNVKKSVYFCFMLGIASCLPISLLLIFHYKNLISLESQDQITFAPPQNTSLGLQFYNSSQIPSSYFNSNIWRWYIYQPHIEGEFVFANGKKIPFGDKGEEEQDMLFIVFDKPVKYSEVIVTTPDPNMKVPPTDIREQNVRFVLIHFWGKVPAGTLNVTFK